LKDTDGLRAYSTKANFCLVELDRSVPVDLLVGLLLIRYGIYVRNCNDKIGLEDGQFIRIASRKRPENDLIISALRDLIPDCRRAA
jgi:histidinol-phosphate/aromatic aminotransferase/cobyric acid decarboxylase-like protein